MLSTLGCTGFSLGHLLRARSPIRLYRKSLFASAEVRGQTPRRHPMCTARSWGAMRAKIEWIESIRIGPRSYLRFLTFAVRTSDPILLVLPIRTLLRLCRCLIH